MQRNCLIFWATLALLSSPAASAELPPTSIRYDIEVRLDPQTRNLAGSVRVRWTNVSTTTITSVPVHLYLNAFSHEHSSWLREISPDGELIDDFLDLYADPWGYSDLVSVRQGSADLAWHPSAPDDGNRLDRTLVEVALAQPVAPGETLILEMEFDARLPVPMARTGGQVDYFFAAQWFPKVAAFELAGVRNAPEDRWVRHQFHGGTEFYSNFADFDVRIGVPNGWTTSATGSGGALPVEEGAQHSWFHFQQRAVHDFAFVTSSVLTELRSHYDPAGAGGSVELRLLVPTDMQHQAPRWRRALEGALDILGARVGAYPYESLTLVMATQRGGRTMGMEYPTLITGFTSDPIWDGDLLGGLRVPELVIVHEFTHQYFYGLVATNEFEDAFLDEGFTSYWTDVIMQETYGGSDALGRVLGRGLDVEGFGAVRLSGGVADATEAIRSAPSYLIERDRIGTQFYRRPASVLHTAARLFGQPAVDAVFAAYFERYAFGHPDADDFLEVARASGGDDLADFLSEALSTAEMPDFRVAGFDVTAWQSPRGRVPTDAGPNQPNDETRKNSPLLGLDEAAVETDGRILMVVTDPGWVRAGVSLPGSIERRSVLPEPPATSSEWQAETDRFHESRVRVEGPGLQFLPVEVIFRFADGVVVRDAWHGKSTWRTYRFLRSAPLDEVSIDPERKVAMDPTPNDNAKRREPESTLTADWSLWFGAVAQWLATGMMQWL